MKSIQVSRDNAIAPKIAVTISLITYMRRLNVEFRQLRQTTNQLWKRRKKINWNKKERFPIQGQEKTQRTSFARCFLSILGLTWLTQQIKYDLNPRNDTFIIDPDLILAYTTFFHFS